MLFDLADWTQLDIGGADRVKFLHNFCTNDIKQLPTGRQCLAFVTSLQGKLLAQFFVARFESRLALVGPPGQAERSIKHLSRYQITEDVTFTDQTDTRQLFLFAGPHAADRLQAAGFDARPLTSGSNCEFPDGDVRILRQDLLRIPGFLLSVPRPGPAESPENGAGLPQELRRAGIPAGSAAVLESLRIAAGFPLHGCDLSDANLAQEAGLTAQAISFTKGCYLGQEPIARIDALGHVNQEIRIVRFATNRLPAPGTEILSAGNEPQPVGRLTTVSRDPDSGAAIALAVVRRGQTAAGQVVQIRIEDALVSGQVHWPHIS